MTNQPKYKLSEQETLAIDSMLRKIAKKKRHQYETCSSRFDYEDVVQNLWIKALEVIQKYQRVDMQLIATAAYGKIVDMVRAEIHLNSTAIDPVWLEWDANDSECEGADRSYLSEVGSSRLTSASEYMNVMAMLDLFEEGTKHRQFLELAVRLFCQFDEAIAGKDETDYSELDGKNENYWTSFIAHKLGYANACSSGFQKIRNQVQAKLASFGYANNYPAAIERLIKLGY